MLSCPLFGHDRIEGEVGGTRDNREVMWEEEEMRGKLTSNTRSLTTKTYKHTTNKSQFSGQDLTLHINFRSSTETQRNSSVTGGNKEIDYLFSRNW